MQGQNANYCVLYHRSGTNELNQKKKTSSALLNDSHTPIPTPNGEITKVTTTVVDIETSQNEQLDAYAVCHRQILQIASDQDLMMAIAWITPHEKRQFMLYPSTLCVDTTMDTNNEKRPLLTVTGRDANGEMFTVLRVLLPNERGWSFRWVFQTVFPVLLGQLHLKNVSLIISDGDAQETSQLDCALPKFFPKAKRMRCAWHIFTRGWQKHCRPIIARMKVNTSLKKLTNTIVHWMYSWSSYSYCESKEEYKLSKALFLCFLNSEEVRQTLGDIGANTIETFFRNHVMPLEDFFCAYQNMSVFSLETTSNAAHEGTNAAMKHCSIPVLPQHSIDRTVDILTYQSQLKTKGSIIENAVRNEKVLLWSNSPTSTKLTDLGESLLMRQWEQRNEYHCCHHVEHSWFIQRKHYSEPSSIVPLFHRVREVKIVQRYLVCSCQLFARIGVPCRHILALLCNLQPQYQGVTHDDVNVFWWRDLQRYGISTLPEHQTYKFWLLELNTRQLQGCGILGPQFPFPISSTVSNAPLLGISKIQAQLFAKDFNSPAYKRCRNYTEDTAKAAIEKFQSPLASGEFVSVETNMRQETFISSNSSNEYEKFNNVFVSMLEKKGMSLENHNKTSSWNAHVPTFKEICNLLDGKFCNEEDKKKFQIEMDKIHAKLLQRAAEQSNNQHNHNGRFVSSHIKSNKRKKSHGTKHMV